MNAETLERRIRSGFYVRCPLCGNISGRLTAGAHRASHETEPATERQTKPAIAADPRRPSQGYEPCEGEEGFYGDSERGRPILNQDVYGGTE